MAKMNIVLSVSGGGILGIGPAQFLKRLEADLGKTSYETFSAFGGTSTGAIIAGALDEGIPADEIVTLYKEKGDKIFKGWSWKDKLRNLNKPLPKYDNSELKSILKELLKGKCSDWGKEIFIPAVDMVSCRNPEKVFDRGDKDIDKWFAVLASTSAPTYFMPAGSDSNWIDGGMVANNPVACTVAGYRNKSGKAKFRALHLETGMLVDRKGSGGNKSLLGWGTYVLNNFVARSETSQTYIAKAMLGEENVFVAQPVTERKYSMDDLTVVSEVQDTWDKYYDTVKDELLKFVRQDSRG